MADVPAPAHGYGAPAQATAVVGTPTFPNSIKWSHDNLIAVASGHLVTILVSNLINPSFLPTLPSSPASTHPHCSYSSSIVIAHSFLPSRIGCIQGEGKKNLLLWSLLHWFGGFRWVIGHLLELFCIRWVELSCKIIINQRESFSWYGQNIVWLWSWWNFLIKFSGMIRFRCWWWMIAILNVPEKN